MADDHVPSRDVAYFDGEGNQVPRMQALPFGVWTKLAHWDGFARSWTPPSTFAELKADGSLLFHGPVELRRELPEVDRA